jgi:hypothetical protein
MNAFLRGHRVLVVRKEFVPDGENSFWTFCLEFLDSPGPMLGGKPPKVDYREVLTEDTVAWTTLLRSAELHSAVSPNCIRQTVEALPAPLVWRKAMQVANLRYSRVQLCASVPGRCRIYRDERFPTG